ncbi:MAG: hypothetical protein ACI90V_009968, partial [Bacillariaceae sp.]
MGDIQDNITGERRRRYQIYSEYEIFYILIIVQIFYHPLDLELLNNIKLLK